MSSPGRPSRPPRRDGSGTGRGRPAGRSGGSGRAGGRPAGRSGGPRARKRVPPRRPLTAAELRAAEVRANRAPRAPRDPEAERARIEARTNEEWLDEGELRAEASEAATRASAPAHPTRQARAPRTIDPAASSSIASSARDDRRAAVLTERLGQAQEALDRERFDDARRIATSLLRELGGVAAVHEVLGLAAYRSGRWKQAATELETSQALQPAPELLPVLADVYRAQRRFDDVERVWGEIREQSPKQDVLAEARIVAASALADQGDLQGALRTMGRSAAVPKRVRDHHLRQWYVLGDLNDRAGDTIEAARWFRLVADHDRDFVDVGERLRALGR